MNSQQLGTLINIFNHTIVLTEDNIITQTEAWIKSVVIGCNFCPFAARPMLRKRIRYSVLTEATTEKAMEILINEMKMLDRDEDIETTLIILPFRFEDFAAYLDLVRKADSTVKKLKYGGIYQVASFHPLYRFEGTDEYDPANYTNRSIYPMLHLLREDSITQTTAHYPETEKIPENNISFARQKGLMYMQLLRAACME